MTSIIIEIEEPQIKAGEVEIDEVTLRGAGWISEAESDARVAEAITEFECPAEHCDDGSCVCNAGGSILARWHDDNHAGAYRFCYEQPCKDIREARL